MNPVVAFVLGGLLGLAIGALVVVALVRATGRISGATPAAVLGLVVDGLRPGVRTDGVATQRALARKLRGTASRAASGRLIGPTAVVLHVSPEDHALLTDTIGLEQAAGDLTDFLIGHARRRSWHLQADPTVELERDISLRPRQAFAQAEVRAEAVPRTPVRPAAPRTASVPLPPRPDEAVTDVLPRADVEEALGDEEITSSYPVQAAEAVGPGDLVIVHGTDVRTVSAAAGAATIGRGPHNDVVVDAPGVAREHVRLERRDTGWWVVPRGVGAKTLLDGRRVDTPAQVDGQALLQLGRGVRVRLTAEPPR